jgi:2-polyprenyl-6-methoxyphenol hydroxylase-like FAD-dependent oxidoreductase
MNDNIIISGAGIGGLILALHLKKAGINTTVYEQAESFGEVGGGIGLYANGLRVIRGISRDLLLNIRAQGKSYELRRWYRHDGALIASGSEKYLFTADSIAEQEELASMGIRRWRLQKCLVDACREAGIPIVLYVGVFLIP